MFLLQKTWARCLHVQTHVLCFSLTPCAYRCVVLNRIYCFFPFHFSFHKTVNWWRSGIMSALVVVSPFPRNYSLHFWHSVACWMIELIDMYFAQNIFFGEWRNFSSLFLCSWTFPSYVLLIFICSFIDCQSAKIWNHLGKNIQTHLWGIILIRLASA